MQLWGLLVELCTMAAPLHVLQRASVYRALCAAGLLQVVSGTMHAQHAPRAVQGRCLDVLLCVLAHDPSLVRRAVLGQLLESVSQPAAAVDHVEASSNGEQAVGALACEGDGWTARALPAGLVGLLARSGDEGTISQVSEALRVLLDPECMEVAEQNGFLDIFYDGGQMNALLGVLQQTTSLLLADSDVLEPATQAARRTQLLPPRDGENPAALVARIEATMAVLLSCVGRHGYRSQRTLQNDGMWHAMHALLRRGPRSLRGSVVRFVRMLLVEQPQCATCVVSHQLLPPMLEMLLERDGACDNLNNSAVLQLLCEIGEVEALSVRWRHSNPLALKRLVC